MTSFSGRLDFRAEEISFLNNGTCLAGDFYLPGVTGPHPIVVMVAGSGPDDRHVAPLIRECFARHGIASLAWDKPGMGGSTGNWRKQAIVTDRAEEVMAGIRFLQSRDDIDSGRIGLWGISQGGWVIPLVASRWADVAFIIPVSAPGITPAEQDVYFIKAQLLADGFPEEQVRDAVSTIGIGLAAGRRKESYAWLEENVLAAARHTSWFRYLSAAVPDRETWDSLVAGEFLDLDYSLATVLEGVACPVLAIFGEQDVLLPVEHSVQVFERSLARAGNKDVTIKLFGEADHFIHVVGTESYAPGYLEFMTSWTLARIKA